MKVSAAVLMLSLSMWACASGAAREPRTDRDVITMEELRRFSSGTLFDAVRQLRPHFLQGRGPTSLQNPESQFPTVRIDGIAAGDISQLRTLTPENVVRVEFISAMDATTRWGTGHTAGVILVTTAR